MQQESVIQVYTTRWCPDCWRAKKVLESHHISYHEVDISQDEDAADLVLRLNHGFRSVPTLVFPDGSTLTEPANHELVKKLHLFKGVLTG